MLTHRESEEQLKKLDQRRLEQQRVIQGLRDQNAQTRTDFGGKVERRLNYNSTSE
jgi:hypothetical protein